MYILDLSKLFFLLSITVFAGCGGTQNSIEYSSHLQLNDKPLANKEINVTKAKEMILNQTDRVLKMYESKDKKSLFVYKRLATYEKSYGLYEYDLTKYPPIVRNEIMSGYRSYLDHLIPLDSGKLAYQTGLFEHTRIILYDYIRNKKIRAYNINFDHIADDIQLSTDTNHIYIDHYDFDISDIYKKPFVGNFKEDDEKNILIDYTNHRIWQYERWVENRQTYTFIEAVQICKNKSDFNWRLPTMNEINSFSLANHDKYPYNLFDTSTLLDDGRHYYWVATDILPTKQAFTYNSNSEVYANFIETDIEEKHYVRCISNLNE